MVVLSVMPVCKKKYNKKKEKGAQRGGFLCVPYDIKQLILISSSQKKNISLQLTTALSCYLPIVFSDTTRYNFIPFNLWWPDWKKFAKLWLCRTGHPHGITLRTWSSLLMCFERPAFVISESVAQILKKVTAHCRFPISCRLAVSLNGD